MRKCSVCGEQIGNEVVCPVCGTINQKIEKVKIEKEEKRIVDIEEVRVKTIEECKSSVAKVLIEYPNAVSRGTGWCGSKDLIITNAHVVVSNDPNMIANNIRCEFYDNKRVLMKPVYVSNVEDIAILMPLSGGLPDSVKVLEISDFETKQGETVFTVGNPLHYDFTYTSGEVANPSYFPKHNKNSSYGSLQTTLVLNGGNSGGPVFNSKGKVVGMATYSESKKSLEKQIDYTAIQEGREPVRVVERMIEIPGYGFCVKSSAILDAIRSAKYKMGGY